MAISRATIGFVLAVLALGPMSELDAAVRADEAARPSVPEATSVTPAKPVDKEPNNKEPNDAEPAKVGLSGGELLGMYGIDQSHFNRLVDARPVVDDENEVLLKILFRFNNFLPVDFGRWVKSESPPTGPGKATRGDIFRLSGRVTAVEILQPAAEETRSYGFAEYYRCDFRLDSGQPALVYTRNVPETWRQGGPVDARSGAYGLFLKFAGDPEHPVPVFVAPRVAWYPAGLLGELRMDAGLFDELEDRKGLVKRDGEAFYQMLAAAGRAKPGQLRRTARGQLGQADPAAKWTDNFGIERFSVVPLFQEPAAQRGRLVTLQGTARRIRQIPVSNPDIVERFGIDHYYNIYMFTEDGGDNPIVFSVRELPAGLSVGEGPEYSESVSATGFFFKTWAYPTSAKALESELPEGAVRYQLAPLLIGREPVWFPRKSPPSNSLVGAIAGILFAIVMAGIWFGLWAYGRGDKEFHDKTFARNFAMAAGTSLNELDPEVELAPDFSGLEAMEEESRKDRESGARDQESGVRDQE